MKCESADSCSALSLCNKRVLKIADVTSGNHKIYEFLGFDQKKKESQTLHQTTVM